jgi:putative transposase
MMAEVAAAAPDVTAVGKKRHPAGGFEIPTGWVARGFEFEVEWPGGAGAVSKIWSQFGARRKAYNWALGQVKADLDARQADPGHVPVPWNLYALRKRWNAEKAVVAPWWARTPRRRTPPVSPTCAQR